MKNEVKKIKVTLQNNFVTNNTIVKQINDGDIYFMEYSLTIHQKLYLFNLY